jgi:hypothetical protein
MLKRNEVFEEWHKVTNGAEKMWKKLKEAIIRKSTVPINMSKGAESLLPRRRQTVKQVFYLGILINFVPADGWCILTTLRLTEGSLSNSLQGEENTYVYFKM